MSWSRWEETGDTGRHWETQTAGVGKGWSCREAPGAQHQESLAVVEAVVVHSPTIHLGHVDPPVVVLVESVGALVERLPRLAIIPSPAVFRDPLGQRDLVHKARRQSRVDLV